MKRGEKPPLSPPRLNFLLFCVPRLKKREYSNQGTQLRTSAEKSLFAVSGGFAPLLGNLPCRVELTALALSCRKNLPPILGIKRAEAPPCYYSLRGPSYRAPLMTCAILMVYHGPWLAGHCPSGFWSGRALATGTAWAGLCFIHHHHHLDNGLRHFLCLLVYYLGLYAPDIRVSAWKVRVGRSVPRSSWSKNAASFWHHTLRLRGSSQPSTVPCWCRHVVIPAPAPEMDSLCLGHLAYP